MLRAHCVNAHLPAITPSRCSVLPINAVFAVYSVYACRRIVCCISCIYLICFVSLINTDRVVYSVYAFSITNRDYPRFVRFAWDDYLSTFDKQGFECFPLDNDVKILSRLFGFRSGVDD